MVFLSFEYTLAMLTTNLGLTGLNNFIPFFSLFQLRSKTNFITRYSTQLWNHLGNKLVPLWNMGA